MPSVPPAASVPVASAGSYLRRRSSGSATWPIVAAVASELPQIAPNPAQAPTAAIATPPRQWPISEFAASNSDLDSPPRLANWPISRNIGITDRSYTENRPKATVLRYVSSGAQPVIVT